MPLTTRGFSTTGRNNQKLGRDAPIIDAARAAVRSKGVDDRGGRRSAQVSVATAYRYFSSPDELVLETMAAPMRDMTLELPTDPAERIDAVVRWLADYQLADEALWRALLEAILERWFKQAEVRNCIVG